MDGGMLHVSQLSQNTRLYLFSLVQDDANAGAALPRDDLCHYKQLNYA